MNDPHHPSTRIVSCVVLLLALMGGGPPGAAQAPDAVPSRLALVELERSRSCVAALASVERLDEVLDPLAQRSRRLLNIADAIALEERSITGQLDPSDPLESDVRAWFATDSLLAVRYVQTATEAIQEQRASGREAVQQRVRDAMTEVQATADSVLTDNQSVLAAAGPCDGAIFVRPTVAEACEYVVSNLCRAVNTPPEEASGFVFVEAPEEIWTLREVRPWTTPTPLQPGPAGLDGARTIGYTRVGNVVFTAAFAPLLTQRSDVTPAELFQFEQTNQALALTFTHPDIAFTPGLALRAALPDQLAEEERYILHFGAPEEPDILWEGAAGTGAPLEASLPLTAAQVVRLRAGDGVTLTAVRGDEPLYSIALTEDAQAASVSDLLRYMATGLGADLMRIAPPSG